MRILMLLLIPIQLHAQSGTDVYVFDLILDDTVIVDNGLNVTRRNGYDNQPSFTSDGKTMYFTSIRDDDQADIYAFDCEKMSVSKVDISVNTSEYSPTETPFGDAISVVRVEEDSTQRLWQFDLIKEKWEVLVKKVEKVGYHCWLTRSSLVVFVLQEDGAHTLELVEDGKHAGIIAENIGRCIQPIPNENAVSFMQGTENGWILQRYEASTGKVTKLVDAMEENDDYVWTPSGQIICGSGSKLFMIDPDSGDNAWVEVADLSADGITDISRLAISPFGKYLAIVCADMP